MLFSGTTFLVVDAAEAASLITQNGGTVYAGEEPLAAHGVSHVVSRSYAFGQCSEARERFLPITTPEWVLDSVQHAQRRNYRLYLPAPAPFMDKVVLCAADNLPNGDKELMYAGTRAFGGQYLDVLLRYTTHLVAEDMSNNKAVVAANICRKEQLQIHIVLPAWLDACMREQRHVPEEGYLLANPEVLRTKMPVVSPAGATSAISTALSHKTVYFHSDFNASEPARRAAEALAEGCGATVVSECVPSEVDIYVGKFRAGPLFWACFDHNTEIASMLWLYHVVSHGYSKALSGNMLHFPIPEKPVPQFSGLRISITGISGDARHYLAQLVAAMGAEFTRTLDANNDILVCGSASGDKYHAVVTRWKNVKLVSHLWVEECFQQWRYLDPELTRYRELEHPALSLGKTRLARENVEREMEVLEIGSSQRSLASMYRTPKGTEHESEEEAEGAEDAEREDADEEEGEEGEGNSQQGEETQNAAEDNSGSESEGDIEQKTPEEFPPEDSVVVVEEVPRARLAKKKASLKLHNDMEDLNKYTSMAKSVRKMKTYMEELETGKKRKLELEGKGAKSARIEGAPSESAKPKVHLRMIMTGCEQTLVLSRADVAKLAKVGISVINDYSAKKDIDTLVAPKILRTEKFLKSLSKASRIIHPQYLVQVLSRGDVSWEDIAREFKIDDYALDKIVPVKQINEDLGYTGKGSGLRHLLEQERRGVFSGMKINLSSNLNGGPDLIASILLEHGLSEAKTVKLSEKNPGFLAMDDETLLVAHKTKDKKANIKGVTVVDWDWCVKSIFHGEKQPYKGHRVGKGE